MHARSSRLGGANLHGTADVGDKCRADRIDTSEFYQQTIFTSDTSEPRVKVSPNICNIVVVHQQIACCWLLRGKATANS
jgi:hypothetical protein